MAVPSIVPCQVLRTDPAVCLCAPACTLPTLYAPAAASRQVQP
jgi:hypothetical protein